VGLTTLGLQVQILFRVIGNNGRAVISPEIAASLIERVSEYSHVVTHVDPVSIDKLNLTTREVEVIADKLVIELGTVKNHVHSILNKLEVGHREDAARLMDAIRRQE